MSVCMLRLVSVTAVLIFLIDGTFTGDKLISAVDIKSSLGNFFKTSFAPRRYLRLLFYLYKHTIRNYVNTIYSQIHINIILIFLVAK